MNKEYTIVNGELYHGGPGSGRWRAGSTGNTAGSRRLLLEMKRPKRNDDVEIMPEGWGSKGSNSNRSSNSTKTSFKQEPPIDIKDKPKDIKTNNKTTTNNTKTNTKTNNNSNNNGNTQQTKQVNPNDALNKEIQFLSSRSKAAKNIGQELQNVARTTEGIKVNRPRMDLSHMTMEEMTRQINREMKELEYNRLFSQPTKKEKAKEKITKMFNTVGTGLLYAGSALSMAVAIKELMKK